MALERRGSSSWTDVELLERFTGTQWVTSRMERFTGTSWVPVMVYNYWLIDENGQRNPSYPMEHVTGGGIAGQGPDRFMFTGYTTENIWRQGTIDFTDYNEIYVRGRVERNSGNAFYVQVYDGNGNYVMRIGHVENTGNFSFTEDISHLTGSHYVYYTMTGGGTMDTDLYEVRLS